MNNNHRNQANLKTQEEREFEKFLERIEDPNNHEEGFRRLQKFCHLLPFFKVLSASTTFGEICFPPLLPNC
ncbi:15102_t:CDS:2 [Gigaspora rosea]|nr:15102_t:CDS:2 [Gigaspora rosea]